MKAKLAFYKGEGNLFDKLVRFWTRSKYSHVEIVVSTNISPQVLYEKMDML